MDGVTRADVALEISLATLSARSSEDELTVELAPASPVPAVQALPAEEAVPAEPGAPAAVPPPPAHAWDCYVEPLLSAYREVLRRSGSGAAAALFAQPPVPSGIARVDTTIGVLAMYLADRDGWPVPDWAGNAAVEAAGCLEHVTPWWFVSGRRGPHASALMESPPMFRRVRVFVRAADLDQGTST